MNGRIELYEECKLWPIRVDLFPDRGLHTLWGDAGGDDDRILADRRGFLLFSTRARLASHVLRPSPTNLTRRPGLPRLRRYLKEHERLPNGSAYVYRFSEVHEILATFDPDRLTRVACNQVVSCLNLLWDVARNLEDQRARAALEGRAPLAKLLDLLSFHDPETVAPPARLRSLDKAALTAAYASLIGLFVLRSRVVA